MNRRCLLPALLVACLPVLAAAQPVPGPYISLGAGVDILQDEIGKPYGDFGVAKRSFSFDAGPGGNLALGYGFGNGLRLEIEGDYARNDLSGVRFPNGVAGHAVGDEQQYGGFANLAYDFDLGFAVSPYIGGGRRLSGGGAGKRIKRAGYGHA